MLMFIAHLCKMFMYISGIVHDYINHLMQLPGKVQFLPQMHQELFGRQAPLLPARGAICGFPRPPGWI